MRIKLGCPVLKKQLYSPSFVWGNAHVLEETHCLFYHGGCNSSSTLFCVRSGSTKEPGFARGQILWKNIFACLASLSWVLSLRIACIIHREKCLALSLGFLSDIICNKAQYVYVSLHRSTTLSIYVFVWTSEVYFLMALPRIFPSAEGNCSAEALTYLAPLLGHLKLWCPVSFYFCNLLDGLGRF